MEKIRSQFPDQLPNLPEGASVRKRPDFPLQMRQYVNGDGSFATRFCKEAFFSCGNANLEITLHGARQVEHVCLRASALGSSNDVQDSRLTAIKVGRGRAVINFSFYVLKQIHNCSCYEIHTG
jgi:hypothetical protein